MMSRFRAASLQLISLALFATIPLCAQVSLGTSSLGGSIRDPGTLAVSGARIVLTDVSRSVSRTTTSNASGDYLFTAVTPGIYSIECTHPGFETTSIGNVRVVVDQRATVDINLSVGVVSQTVEVNEKGERRCSKPPITRSAPSWIRRASKTFHSTGATSCNSVIYRAASPCHRARAT
jgi:hypothetical protein